jgi:hypothetical protein
MRGLLMLGIRIDDPLQYQLYAEILSDKLHEG